jgi:Ca2+-binding RTX toxin-like protein
MLSDDAEVEYLETTDDNLPVPLNLTGNALANEIVGNVGANVIDGRGGADVLRGLGGADTFLWSSVNETGLTQATADRIADFSFAQGDLIDLSAIDADIVAAGNQAFTFIGTAAFSGAPGELRYYHAGGSTYLEMQIGTAADVEGVIRLDGIHTPAAGWFML